MKHIIALTMLLLFSVTTLFAQKMSNSQRKSPHDTISGKHITITYGRPYKKGRDIFGALEPYGKVWRTGADEATQITIDKDCKFAGHPLKAGTYTLFTTPGENKWSVILNSELNQWGAFGYDKVKDKDVLEASIDSKHLDKTIEQFTITINNSGLQMEWDHTRVTVPITF